MAKLVVVGGPQRGQEFELRKQIILGRNYHKGIPLVDKTVSSKHAMIAKHGNCYTIYDLGSTNKTHVNKKPIDCHTLCAGDKITFGDTILVFVDNNENQKREQSQSTLEDSSSMAKVSIVSNTLPAKIVSRCSADTILQESESINEDSIKRIRQRFRFLCHISNTVGIELSLDNILKDAMQSLAKFFPQVERGVIFLAEQSTEVLSPAISVNFTKQAEEEISVSSTILSEAVSQRVSLMSSNAMLDGRFDGPSILMQRIKFAMCSPLLAQDELLGAIYLDSTTDTGRFTSDDLALLAGVASQVAVAIKNAHLHQFLVKTEKLNHELAIARELQQNFLASHFPEFPGVSFSARTEPAQHVGGDFYDMLELANNRIGLVVGDVSGKGVGAALYMASLISEFRFLARSDLHPQKLFAQLNQTLVARSTRGMFVTLLYIIIDLQTREAICVNAGHHPPLVLIEGSVYNIFSKNASPPLGIMNNIEYTSTHHTFEGQEFIILYTDGILEAKNPQKEEYGKIRLHSALENITKAITSKKFPEPMLQPSPSHRIIDSVFTDVKAFCGVAPQHDDLTMAVTQLI